MAARHLAGLALLLLPSLALASVPITEFRQPSPASSRALGPDGMPIPERAGALVRLGTLIVPWIVIAMVPPDGTDGLGALVILQVVAGLVTAEAVYDVAAVEGVVRRHNATRVRPTSWRIEPCLTPSTRAPGLALRANFGGAEGSR